MIKNISKILTFFFLIIITGCSEKNNPLSSGEPAIDMGLIGEWYKIETTSGLTRPQVNIWGFQINNNGSKIPVAVETSTGRLMLSEYTYTDTIIYAFNGNIILKRFFPPYVNYDTLNYYFKDDTLVFDRGYIQELYIRSSIGALVTEPLISETSAEIDEIIFENFKVYPAPSAFAGVELTSSSNKFLIEAISSNQIIIIVIENFTGEGIYNLGGNSANKGSVNFKFDDFFIVYETDINQTGSIVIDNYDLITKRCSGSFSFNSIHNFSEIKEIKNGVFDLPVYSSQ